MWYTFFISRRRRRQKTNDNYLIIRLVIKKYNIFFYICNISLERKRNNLIQKRERKRKRERVIGIIWKVNRQLKRDQTKLNSYLDNQQE